MAFDIQLRTPAGIKKVSELQAIRHIGKLNYPVTISSANMTYNVVTRTHTQSLRGYTDFSGKLFTIFATGGCTNKDRGGIMSVDTIWNGGRIITASSTFQVRFAASLVAAGTFRYIIDMYIVEN